MSHCLYMGWRMKHTFDESFILIHIHAYKIQQRGLCWFYFCCFLHFVRTRNCNIVIQYLSKINVVDIVQYFLSWNPGRFFKFIKLYCKIQELAFYKIFVIHLRQNNFFKVCINLKPKQRWVMPLTKLQYTNIVLVFQ